MKIVIDIDDHEYAEIKEDAETFRNKGMVVPHLYKVIESGTPIPKAKEVTKPITPLDEEIINKIMNFQQIIIDSQSKDIQEISRDYVKLQEKYTKLKEAMEKIKEEISNSKKDSHGNLQPYIECDKCLEIFDKHIAGLI